MAQPGQSPFVRAAAPLPALAASPAHTAGPDTPPIRFAAPAAGATVAAVFGPAAETFRGYPLAEYSYAGTAGERLHVRADSGAVLAVCIVGAAQWAAVRADTGGTAAAFAGTCAAATGGQRPEVATVLPTDGDVVVLAVGAPGGEGSRYRLTTVEAGRAVDLLADGAATRATLGDGDEDEVVLRQPIAAHYVKGNAGDRLVVTVASTVFSPYAEVGTGTGSGYRALVGNEADASGTSQIQLVLPATGVYSVLLGDARGRRTGAYTIRAQRTASRPWAEVYPGSGDPDGRYALLVGVGDYPGLGPAGAQSDLRGPRTDTETMRALLVDTYGFDPAHVVVLEDAEATREGVVEAVRRHLGQAGPAGSAVFYYSGHGMQIPTDALTAEPDGQDESLVLWGRGGDVATLLDFELGALLDSLQAGHTVAVLDNCFSGTGTRGAEEGFAVRRLDIADVAGHVAASDDPVADRPADRTAEPERHVLLAASRSDQPSLELDGLGGLPGRRGVFTHFLAAALRDAGPDATFESVVAEIRPRVMGATRLVMAQAVGGDPQQPQVEGAQRTVGVRRCPRATAMSDIGPGSPSATPSLRGARRNGGHACDWPDAHAQTDAVRPRLATQLRA